GGGHREWGRAGRSHRGGAERPRGGEPGVRAHGLGGGRAGGHGQHAVRPRIPHQGGGDDHGGDDAGGARAARPGPSGRALPAGHGRAHHPADAPHAHQRDPFQPPSLPRGEGARGVPEAHRLQAAGPRPGRPQRLRRLEHGGAAVRDRAHHRPAARPLGGRAHLRAAGDAGHALQPRGNAPPAHRPHRDPGVPRRQAVGRGTRRERVGAGRGGRPRGALLQRARPGRVRRDDAEGRRAWRRPPAAPRDHRPLDHAPTRRIHPRARLGHPPRPRLRPHGLHRHLHLDVPRSGPLHHPPHQPGEPQPREPEDRPVARRGHGNRAQIREI
ncbi:MAG: Beta-lactamase class C-like and penicillin binding proteins (PBPs) superfamily, partial [uncultured Gemmatimonadetes bacterium]